MTDANFDDIWDSEVNERDYQLNLHNNFIINEKENLEKLNYNEGFLAGSDFEDLEEFNKGYLKGIEYTSNFGIELGRIDSILILDKLKIEVIENCKRTKLEQIKKEIEENTYKIRENLNKEIEEILKCQGNCNCK